MFDDSSCEDLYQKGPEIKSGKSFRVFEATDKTAGSPCFFHEFRFGDEITELIRQRIFAQLQRYARLATPRTPRYPDAWVQDDKLVVVEFKTVVPPMGMGANNPLEGDRRFTTGEFFESTLQLLAGLHNSEVIHGHLRPECYGIGPLDRLYIIDSGIDESLVELVEAEGAADFFLSENRYNRDLALWAYWMLSMHMDEPIYGLTDDVWDEIDVKEVKGRLESIVPEQAREFFTNCLLGFTSKGGLYESAKDAFASFLAQNLRSVLK